MGRISKQIKATGQRHSEVYRYACLHRSKRINFHFLVGVDGIRKFEEDDDVLHWWRISMDLHVDRYEFIQTAWFAGADQKQLQLIAFHYWGLNDLDCLHYVHNSTGLTVESNGNKWKVYDDRRQFDPESPEGTGTFLLLAVIDYRIKAAKRENERLTQICH